MYTKTFRTGSVRFLKYQIVTKALLAILILPLFRGITQLLISGNGRVAVSNSDLFSFLFSPQGVLFMVIGVFLVMLILMLEVGGFVLMSAQVVHGQPESSYMSIFKENFRILPRLFGFGSIPLLLYMAVMVPLSGTGVTLSIFEALRIPNFIMHVIWSQPLYTALYIGVIFLMVVLSLRWTFTIHFIVLGNMKPTEGMRASARVMRRHWLSFLKSFAWITVKAILAIAAVAVTWGIIIALITGRVYLERDAARVLVSALLIFQYTLYAVIAALFVPFEVFHATRLFYTYVNASEDFEDIRSAAPRLPGKNKASLLDRLLGRRVLAAVLFVAVVILFSIPVGIFFKDIFVYQGRIDVIGHRGGGGSRIPENTLSAIDVSIKHGAAYVEIDVQRARDGQYVIFHDTDFKRMAAQGGSITDMTWAEIKAIDVGSTTNPAYASERVPTLDQVFSHCKGRMGIFLELKGKTADRQMADDLVARVKREGMTHEVVFMSLNYDLMRYIEETYPEMETGFVYFLAFGDVGAFHVDTLILEEDAAREETIDAIHSAGKRAVVWTVNSLDGMNRFVRMDVDGIITDEVEALQGVLQQRDTQTDRDFLLTLFFGDE